MSNKRIPKELKHLRACLLCSLVKTTEQFQRDGCDNCDQYFKMKHNRLSVQDYTSSSFDGLIAAMAPDESWVCKWQRIDKFVPGLYAISVSGKLQNEIINELKSKGVQYRSRDTSTGFVQ